MENTLYNFGDVEANSDRPTVINDAIASVLRHNGGACYAEMERFLMAPGVTGSKSFDQGRAVLILLKHDDSLDGVISNIMDNTAALTEHALWSRLSNVLRKTGFKFKFGRLVGLLEHKPTSDTDSPAEPGEPDVA